MPIALPSDVAPLPALVDVAARAEADPAVVGLVLSGSQARTGMATHRSDVDVYLVLADEDGRETTHSPDIDIAIRTVAELREVPGPDTEAWYDRYAFAHSRVLLDRAGGEVARLVRGWGTLSDAEAPGVRLWYLDGYINFVYRSLKSARDGRVREARLDAAESLMWGLPLLFAFENRIRPYNKYVGWELTRHPLANPAWSADRLLPLVDRILDDADVAAQRLLYAGLEAAAVAAGHGDVVDSWHAEQALLRGTEPAA